MALTPFLMFQGGQAEEAIRFYAAVFPDAEILDLDRYESADEGPPGAVKGSVKGAAFRIANQTMRGFAWHRPVTVTRRSRTSPRRDRLAAGPHAPVTVRRCGRRTASG
jgi:predicted 3-demethylubiquinone-9 3-methyltransferase (glyoxalase superfamily)